mgnify:CR=1 FL=1
MATFITDIETRPDRGRARRESPRRRFLIDAKADRPSPERAKEPYEFRPASLLDEARRRMKSNMEANISILRLVPSGTEHPEAEAVLTEMENRLQSMAALRKAQSRSGNFGAIDLAVYLRQAASLRNSPPHSPLPGGWLVEPGGTSLSWSREEDGNTAAASEGFMDLETALSTAPARWQDLAQRAVYACAIVVPPWIFRWRSPQSGTAGSGHLARPGEVGLRVRVAEDGVAVELSFSDCGPGLPGMFDLKAQRALSLELVAVLARLVQGSLNEDAPSDAVFEVNFVPSHRDFGSPFGVSSQYH